MLNVRVQVRTPHYQIPIAIVMKATNDKVYRQVHCISCGMPFAEITDQIVSIQDYASPITQMKPDEFGFVAVHCPRKQCQQRYRFDINR